MGLTVRDIADACGVNASTVSRALRDDPRVKADTRVQIRDYARKHGYTPNLLARNLAAGKTNTIWLILGSLNNELEQKPAQYLSQRLREAGYDLLIVLDHNSETEFSRLLDKLRQKVTDAALIIPPFIRAHSKIARQLRDLPLPVLFIDRWISGSDTPAVSTDNAAAALRLVEYCHQQGARTFFTSFDGGNTVAKTREKTVHDYLRKHRLPCYQDITPENIRLAAGAPAAILGNSGKGVYQRLSALSETLPPDQCFYGGFFDYWENETKGPFQKLLICRQDFEKISMTAADNILKMLAGESLPEQLSTVPPMSFLEL